MLVTFFDCVVLLEMWNSLKHILIVKLSKLVSLPVEMFINKKRFLICCWPTKLGICIQLLSLEDLLHLFPSEYWWS